MKEVKINFDGSLKAAFKKLQSQMQADSSSSFERSVQTSVDMFARNGQLKRKDLAMHQMTILAERYGVKAVV